MFYSNQILARKGPLGLVWIAAHMDRQLKRQQINNTSIAASVDTLLDPEVPLALRLSGQLLLGVVRIYARKVNYLQQDCNDALVKIRVALKAADSVSLPPGSQTAPVESITILGPRAVARSSKGRTTAVAATAGPEASGNVEDAFGVGLDDLYWEQDVLLGGSSGFGGLDFGGLDLGFAPSGSGPLSQDISGVFGMASTDDDQQEMFDMEDEEAAALWDLNDMEVERLRAAPSQQMSDGGGLSGLVDPSGTPRMAGPTGKGADTHSPDSTAAEAAVAGDEMMTQAGDDLPSQGAEVTPGAAAAAQGSPGKGDQGSAGSPGGYTGGGYTGGSLGPVAALPPTPATTGSGGPSHAVLSPVGDLQDLLPATPHSDLAADTGAAAIGPAPQQEGPTDAGSPPDMMDVDLPAATAAGAEQMNESQGTEQAADEQRANAAPEGQPAKTFQRRTTHQQVEQRQQHEPSTALEAAAEADSSGSPATAAAAADKHAKKAAAKAARQRRTSALLGHKRRAVIDSYDIQAASAATAADGNGSSRRRSTGGHAAAAAANRQPPTELPAAEIRALLANRAPLLDMSRGQTTMAQLRAVQTAATATANLSMPLTVPLPLSAATGASLASGPSARTAAAAAVAATFGSATKLELNATSSRSAAYAALLGAISSTSPSNTLAAPTSSVTAGVAGVLCHAASTCSLPLPPELQDLFFAATSAAAAADTRLEASRPPMEGADAVAPLASLEEIGVVEEEDFLDAASGDGGGSAGPANRLNPGAATRRSLALSLVSTPGVQHQTPGTVQQPGAASIAGGSADHAGPAGSGLSAGCNQWSGSAGFDGYTPGSFAGITPGAAAADAAGLVVAGEDNQARVLQDIVPADIRMSNQDTAFTQHLPEDFVQQYVEADNGSDKENEGLQGLGVGKAAMVAAAGVHDLAAGLGFGSSGRSTQEAVMPWPADAENLMVEQAGEDPGEVADGGFTSRTRLVVRCLQHAAAHAAAGGDVSGSLTGTAGTPVIGSKRRISAAPPPSSGKTAQQQKEQQQLVTLSLQSLTQGYSRLDACRCFYEVLVLGNKGLVNLEQQESYGDIKVTPDLAAMARV